MSGFGASAAVRGHCVAADFILNLGPLARRIRGFSRSTSIFQYSNAAINDIVARGFVGHDVSSAFLQSLNSTHQLSLIAGLLEMPTLQLFDHQVVSTKTAVNVVAAVMDDNSPADLYLRGLC